MKNKLVLNIQKFADDNTVNLKIKQQKDGDAIAETTTELGSLSKMAKALISSTGFKKLTTDIINVTKKSADYIETLNLLDVAYNQNTKDIEKFSNTIADTLNLDDKTILQSAAHFKVLTQSMGLANETGEKLSKLMTQMTLDVSSLYNMDFDKAQRALQYAMEGRGTSLKQRTGVSVLETSVQTTLDALGVDAYVKDMNDAEKALARVISMEYQLMSSQGDLARTIEAPANQFRVLGEQVALVGRNIGNIFLPMMAKILPYVNAVLIVINTLLSALAKLVGYKAEDYDFGVDSSTIDYYDDLGSSIGGVGDAAESTAKKLRGLRGFDKLNVITTPDSSGGSGGVSGGGGGGGMNPSLLEAFDKMSSKYKNMLDGVQTKASKIAEDILNWLGFTKEIDKETGKVSWKFDHITSGTVLGALAAGGVIFKGVYSVYSTLKKIGLLKFPLVTKLISSITGKTTAGAKVAKDATEMSKTFKGFSVPNVKTILKGLADLALIIGGLIAIVAAVGALTKIPGFTELTSTGIQQVKDVFWGLASTAIPIAEFSVLIGVMGNIGVATFAKGLADLAIVILGTEVVITAAGAISQIAGDFISSGVEAVKKVFNCVADIGLPLTLLSAGLMVAGLLGGAGVAGIAIGLADLAIVILGTEAIIAAAGAVSQIPGFDWLIGEGIKSLKALFEGIGEIAGSIVKGFLNVAFSGLEDVGTHLSGFMTNAQPFFEGASKIDTGLTESVRNIAQTIILLTVADVLDGLTSWLTGGVSFEEFGKELAKFAPYFVEYSNAIKDVDASVIESSSKAGLTLAQFGRDLPNQGGVVAWFTGDNTIDEFGKKLPQFGKDMKKYSENIAGIDTNVVESSSKAAESLSKFAKDLPNKGGVVSWFTGDNTIDEFGEVLPQFGKDMKKYSDNIKNMDANVVTKSADAAKSLASFSDEIPNKGGLVSLFTGDNTMADFGYDLKEFGNYFKQYYDKIKNISMDKVNSVTNGIKDLLNTFIKIKNNGINDTIENFGSSLKNAAGNITSFFNEAVGSGKGWDFGYSFGSSFGNGLSWSLRNYSFPKIRVSETDSGSTLSSFRISAYAQGGLPDVGQMFIANERGPELVGQIGGQSFVANQNQMLDIIDKKLSNAGGLQNATFNIQVGNEEIAHVVLHDLNQMAKSNGKPITING